MTDPRDIKRELGIDQSRRPNDFPPLSDFTVTRTTPPKPAPPVPMIPEDDDDATGDD